MPEPQTAKPSPLEKTKILLAASQLDMLVKVFTNAPERVQKSAIEFRDALKEWANGN